MNVLIYDNKGKDIEGIWLNKLIEQLTLSEIEYKVLSDDELTKSFSADALFSLGGDGTLLYLNEFSNRTNIPLIGINTGKMGFLSEFERNNIKEAVDLFRNRKLIKEERICAEITYNGKSHLALNEACVQRVYSENSGLMVSNIDVSIDGSRVLKVKGDGLIVSTPTGTTAYSLSAGGPILAPGVSAFSITPIAAHSLSQRAIVGGANSEYVVTVVHGANAGLYADGRYIATLKEGHSFSLRKHNKPTTFLRKPSYDFFVRLHKKLKENFGEEND